LSIGNGRLGAKVYGSTAARLDYDTVVVSSPEVADPQQFVTHGTTILKAPTYTTPMASQQPRIERTTGNSDLDHVQSGLLWLCSDPRPYNMA
jgi:hypothetical protein